MSDVKLYLGDCLDILPKLEAGSIDLTITSPPYDNLRKYNGYKFDFQGIAKELYRVTSTGGVIVWIVNDETVNGSKTGTSFRQALYFLEIGFNLHDTMIWNKQLFTAVGSLTTRYAPIYDFMFILSKGKPKTFNPIKDRKNKWAGAKVHGNFRLPDGSYRPVSNNRPLKEFGQRFNIWEVFNTGRKGTEHPATFPLQLAKDHIVSWSNPGDIVLDPMMGSGTTGKATLLLERNFIGIEIDPTYYSIAESQISKAQQQIRMEI